MTARLICITVLWSLSLVAWAQDFQRVPESDLYDALMLEKAKGYALTATTNGARLWSNVLQTLVRAAQARDPDGPPLFIAVADYYAATLRATGIPSEEVPITLRLAYLFQQNSLVEFRRHRIIDTTATNPLPELALGIRTWWADSLALPDHYAFKDTLSDPELHVINDRVITYRLLHYDDMDVIDQMKGLRGRPTSGVLGLLFKLIGAGKVVFSRSTTVDSLQIVYAKAKRIFSKSATITVLPSGQAVKGLLEGRPELRAVEQRLKKDRRVRYRTYVWEVE